MGLHAKDTNSCLRLTAYIRLTTAATVISALWRMRRNQPLAQCAAKQPKDAQATLLTFQFS